MYGIAGRMTVLTYMLSISLMTEALLPIRACPEPEGACNCISADKSVSCTRLGSLTNRLPIGIPVDTKRLIVKYSSLKRLGPNAFRSSYLFEHIDLCHNMLEEISDNAFRDLIYLDTMLLCENKLRFLDSAIFLNLKKLRVLDLSKNRIVVLTPQNFYYLSDLQTLDLRQNPIMCIASDALSGLYSLQQLMLSNTSASLNSQLLSCSPVLTKLDISFANSLSSIPEDIFKNNVIVQELRLTYLPKLGNSGISNNLLSGQRNMRIVSFEACNLSRVPVAVLDKVKWTLRSLDLSKNPLLFLEGDQLTFLYLLESLNLQHTGMHSINVNALNLHRIVIIDLGNNRLSTLQEEVFGSSIPSNLENVKLGNNPWICDCKIRWLSRSKFFQNTDTPAICTEPQSMQGVDIYYALKDIYDSERFECYAPNVTTFGIKSNAINGINLGSSRNPFTQTLSCQANGYPKPAIYWVLMRSSTGANTAQTSMFKWKDIQRNPRFLLKHNSCDVCKESTSHPQINIQVDDSGNLVFRSVLPRDAAGIYICIAENDYGIDQKMFLITKSNRLFYEKNKRSVYEKLARFTESSKNASFDNTVHHQSLLKEHKEDFFLKIDANIDQNHQHYYRFKKFLLKTIPNGLSNQNAQIEQKCTQNVACKKLGKYATKNVPQSTQAEDQFRSDETYSAGASGVPSKNSQADLSLFISNFTFVSLYIVLELLR